MQEITFSRMGSNPFWHLCQFTFTKYVNHVIKNYQKSSKRREVFKEIFETGRKWVMSRKLGSKKDVLANFMEGLNPCPPLEGWHFRHEVVYLFYCWLQEKKPDGRIKCRVCSLRKFEK
jgi:hypothetical protein